MPVDGDRVVAGGCERRPVPGGEPLGEGQARRCAVPVVLGEGVPAPELEPGDERAARPDVAGAPGDDRGAAFPAAVNSGTLPAMITASKVRPRSRVGEIVLDPLDVGSGAARGGEHRRVECRRPTTSSPCRANSIATRPVPHPASSTDAGSGVRART